MKKSFIQIGVIALVLLAAGGWFISTYNGLVALDENVKTKWGDLQSAYQRRTDLYASQLPVVVAGSAQELAVFKELVAQAQALSSAFKTDAGGNPIVPTGADAQALSAKVNSFNAASTKFLAYAASNPAIVSGKLFSDFMISIEGTENRINVARRDYNSAVQGFKLNTRAFPSNLIAGMLGFNADQYSYFEAQAGAQNAPTLIFPTPAQP